MVATLSPAHRFARPSVDLQTFVRMDLFRFTWDDVKEMVRLGMLPEDASFELLDGLIVAVDRGTLGKESPVPNPDHVFVTESLSDLRGRINSPARHVRSQQPLRCSPTYAPLPDFMVVRGRLGDYPDDAPSAADVFCVVEVADSSLERDARLKLAAYARAGVPQYVIVNLRDRSAEAYATPDVAAGTYPPPTLVAADGTLSLRIGDGEMFDMRLADVLASG